MKLMISMHIIVIVGGSGSGKGYLAKNIQKQFWEDSVGIIPHDMYYHPHNRYPGHLEVMYHGSKVKIFDHPDAFEDKLLISHIRKLQEWKEVEIPKYDFWDNKSWLAQRHRWEIMKPKKIMIIDGIMALHSREIREIVDTAVFIDVSGVNRIARRIIRDYGETAARASTTWWGIAKDIQFYLDFVDTGYKQFVANHKEYADIVVSNDVWVEEWETPQMVDVVSNYLKGKYNL